MEKKTRKFYFRDLLKIAGKENRRIMLSIILDLRRARQEAGQRKENRKNMFTHRNQ